MKQNKENVRFEQCMCVEGNEAWIPTIRNGVAKISITDKTAYVKKVFERYGIMEEHLYCSVIKADGRIILIPGKAKEIAIFDSDSDSIEYIEYPIPHSRLSHYKDYPFFKATKVGENIYIYGIKYPGIIKLNYIDKTIEIFDDWVDQIEKKYGKKRCRELIIDGGCLVADKIFMPLAKVPVIVAININDDSTEIYHVACEAYGFDGCIDVDGRLYLVGETKKGTYIYKWSQYQGIEDIIKLDDYAYDKSLYANYWGPFVNNGYLYLFPGGADCAYRVSLSIHEVKKIIGNEIFGSEKKEWKTWTIGQFDERILFQTSKDRIWHMYNCESGTLEEIGINTDDSLLSKCYISEFLRNNANDRICIESNAAGINGFVRYITNI